MAEVKRSTSQDAVLEGDKSVAPSSYDLNSWQGLTAVLQAAREANLGQERYAEFRNLVLEYAQKRGEKKLREEIDAIIKTFTTKTVVETPTSEGKKEESVLPRIEPTETVTPKDETEEVEVVEAKPTIVTSTDGEVPSFIPHQFEQQANDAEPQPVDEEKIIPSPISEPVKMEIKSLEEYRSRIAEIKRIVNAQVKNPISLVDDGNQIGRTYMTALLGAMKATGPGSPDDPHVAMRVLEEAFEGIEAYIAASHQQEASVPKEELVHQSTEYANHSKESEIQPSSPVNPEPLVEKRTETIVENLSQEESLTQSAEEAEATYKKSEVSEPIVVSEVPFIEESEIVVQKKNRQKALRQNLDTALERARSASYETLRHTEEYIDEPQQPVTWAEPTVPPPEPSSINISVMPPTTRNEYPIDLSQEGKESMTQVVVRQSELASSQITEALNQLLHQWKIFASSGIFGMGPGGMEHPLYERLSRLSMGEVVTGRWENADPDITRTIKDYVDAWRHEQGIAFNPTETFEHYLRRVVQRILKRQRGDTGV